MMPEDLNRVITTQSGQFELKVTDPGDPMVVLVNGELDAESAFLLRSCITDVLDTLGRNRLIVDISGCGYMDSAGMGALLGRYRQNKESQAAVIVAAPTPRVDRLLNLTRLHTILSITRTVDEARALVARETKAPKSE